mmetsp:Transcript_24997/g.70162  ORF Transcript_24997/g.70162 Transcript_24997/m.70162 type:complete len:472 (+) Transcript_24997:145-1560(+)
MHVLFKSLLLCATTIAARSAGAAAIESSNADDDVISELTNWVKSAPDAFLSDNIAIRRFDDNDPESPRGVFATEDIAADEPLFSIPWDIVMKPEPVVLLKNDGSGGGNSAETMDGTGKCQMILTLYDEMIKPDATPFVKSMKPQKQRHRAIPTLWSHSGKKYLSRIVYNSLLPTREDIYNHEHDLFWDECSEHLGLPVWEEFAEGNMENAEYKYDYETLIDAWFMQATRADVDILVPYYSMINHSNGRRHNTVETSVVGKHISAKASRKIAKGEQIYISYSHCERCSLRGDGYSTGDIFLDYGFVEEYPRTFFFDWDSSLRLFFQVDRTETTGALDATFLAPLDQKAMTFMTSELQYLMRLKVMLSDAESSSSSNDDYHMDALPPHEKAASDELHDAYITAFVVALQSAENATLTNDVWHRGSHWYASDWEEWMAGEQEDEWDYDYHYDEYDFDAEYDISRPSHYGLDSEL